MEIISAPEIKPAVESFVNIWHDDSDCILAHTSGSTGTPKEIRLSKGDMLCSADATCSRFGIDRDSILVCPLSIEYIAGKMMIVRAIHSGSTLHMLTPANDLTSELNQFDHIDLLAIVPSQVPSLLKLSDISYIKNIIIGGAPLDVQLENELIRRGANAYCTYGMTETCSHVALRKVGETKFIAMPGIEFTTDSLDRLIIDAPNYSFQSLVTNDIVRLESPTSFQWIGRSDNIINTGGIKVSPEALEQRLTPHMRGLPFYISSQPSAKWGSEIIMIIQSDRPPLWLQEVIDKTLDKRLKPKYIYCLPRLNVTYNGKLRRDDIIKNSKD